jgi:alpha-glucoside transport system permease protein
MEERIIGTVIGVVVAIVGSAIIFIGANKWFDQAGRHWKWFGAITGGVIGGVASTVLLGNRVIAWKTSSAADATDLTWLLAPLYVVLVGLIGYLLNGTDDRTRRMLVGGGGGLVVAGSLGAFVTSEAFLAPSTIDVIIWPIIGAALFGGIKRLRNSGLAISDLIPAAVTGAGLGWVVGSWGLGTIGSGTRLEAGLGFALAGLALGLRFGLTPNLDKSQRDRLQNRSRAVIFLSPALLFIAMTLIVPTIGTFLLSFEDARGEEFVGGDNYADIFTNPQIFNIDNIGGIFTSRLTIFGVVAAALGWWVARRKGREVGAAYDWTGGSITPIAIGATAVAFGIFTTLRGTFWNNVWWVAAVTSIATSLGLAVAVLSDRSKGEKLAKSLIFMPMAISFIGAGIIWRFMYLARPPSVPQTGVLNTLWVGLGEMTMTRSIGFWVMVLIIGGIAVGAVLIAVHARRVDLPSRMWMSGMVAGLFVLGLIGVFSGVGGGALNEAGDFVAEPYFFLETRPWNNFWLMVVLIWIQTGFAMVVLSAAIKGVPTDLIEASKVDGATESETFWRVIIPQVSSTIGVVTTTLIVLVMKVFDIPKVMTAGQFETNVLANEMFQQAFTNFNRGLGAAVAMVLFFLVLPVMIINIRRDAEAV